MTPGRLGLLLTSPRVAPGLLSHAAWEAVAGSGLRLARSLQDPLAEAVEESGFAVEEVGDASPAELAPVVEAYRAVRPADATGLPANPGWMA